VIFIKKTVRDMLRHKRAYISCILLMAIGVWTYTTMNTALLEIEKGKNDYYETQRLGDVFASVSQMPVSALNAIESIDGIETAEGRYVVNARVIGIKGEVVQSVKRLKVISSNGSGTDMRINNYIYSESDINNPADILLGYDFYQGNQYQIDDSITLLIEGKKINFNIKGSVYSPEYVYIVEKEGDLFSDTADYNIAYVDESTLTRLIGVENIYNDISFELTPGYTYDDVKNELNESLKKYGLISLIERDDLFSYRMLEEEIAGGRSMSTTLPMAFVSMAAVVLYLMLKRIIEQDRAEIGTLKAFGYSNFTILLHYTFYGIITGVIGAVVGLVISRVSVGGYIQIYLDYYKLPIGTEVTDYKYYAMGGFWAIFGGIAGAFFGARAIIRLKPADAMRPKAPKPVKKDIVQIFPVLQVFFNSRGVMAIRNMTRNKIRSTFIIVGIAFAYSMMVMIGMMTDLMDAMFTNQFEYVLKYDAELTLNQFVPYEQGVQSAMTLPGVVYAEGILKSPTVFEKGHKKAGGTLVGLKEGDYLYRLYDDTSKVNIKLNRNGIVLGSLIADRLGAKKGDQITLENAVLKKRMDFYVSEVVEQSVGANAYVDIDLISDYISNPGSINTIIFNTSDLDKVRDQLLYSKAVTKVEDKQKTLALYESLLGSYDFLIVILQGIAIVISFTIIYNTAVITMSERSREYATLRVLGLDIEEVKEIMSLEYWVLSFLGVAIGVPFSLFLNTSLVNMIDIDAFAWPSEIPAKAYIIGVIGTAIAVMISNQTTLKSIRNLNLVEVLKERE